MGDKKAYIDKSMALLNKKPGIGLLRAASVYRTAPVGKTDQDWFLNTVVELEVSLRPEELLAELQQIEEVLGRVRRSRWGPRTIDLDLLLYENLAIKTPKLVLPHPRMHQRAFVMVPLAELIPDRIIHKGFTAGELAEKLMLEQEIERLSDN